ncbi:flagellar protein FlaG [Heliophilum fasciatum]|nr:flagellar protein FlaG [Heliophilum fasciatum]MCW2278778.1 flagellar protein FlaG [Heliophilum fasciatum]
MAMSPVTSTGGFGAVSNPAVSPPAGNPPVTAPSPVPSEVKATKAPDAAVAENTRNQATEAEKTLSKDQLSKLMDDANQFLSAINTDLRFAWHDKTERLMVQVVDQRDNRVLKEIPSREFLDTMARIREFVGALLDKKA